MVSTPARVDAPSSIDAPQAMPRLRPLASMTDAMVNPSGILCRKMARKMTHPSQLETMKPEAIAMPSKKVWMISPMSTEYPRWPWTNASL